MRCFTEPQTSVFQFYLILFSNQLQYPPKDNLPVRIEDDMFRSQVRTKIQTKIYHCGPKLALFKKTILVQAQYFSPCNILE